MVALVEGQDGYTLETVLRQPGIVFIKRNMAVGQNLSLYNPVVMETMHRLERHTQLSRLPARIG